MLSSKMMKTQWLLAVLLVGANAHTWIEQMMVIAPNGTMIGKPGYPRGFVPRSSPGFSDPTMVNLIPPDGGAINVITPEMLMCMPSQTSPTQTNGSPRLQAAPGAAIALRYQENGHVTLPANQPGKPPNRGTVYVYGTTESSPTDSLIGIHRVWNAEGTGGDKRGVLLSTQNFDDGQCYQVNSGTISAQRQKQFSHTASPLMGGDVWCQQDIQLPSNAPSGKPYTLYWVWDWPTMPGTSGFPAGKQELYTTCMDVDVTGTAAKSTVDFALGQDLNFAAISSELAQLGNPTAVTGASIPFSGATAGATAPGPASTVPAATATTEDSTFTATALALTGNGATATGIAAPKTSGLPAGSAPGQAQHTYTGAASTPTAAAQAGGSGLHTFTHWNSVTETVYQTVFNKRSVATPILLSTEPVETSNSPSPSIFTLRGRTFRA